MSRRLRVAGIGAGYFSRFHYDAWHRMEGAELTGICDHDRARAEAMAEGVGAPPVFDDAGAMLQALEVDLVDIVTPPATHADLVALVAGHGLPMICQKPLAPTHAEAERIVATAEAAGVPLIVHENFRWQPWYREAKRLIETGILGEVYGATFRLRPGDGQGPRAYLDRQPYFQDMPRFLIHETGIHFIDVFRFLLGEVERVSASLRRLNPAIAGEDAGHVLFGMADGRTALFDGNRLVDHAAENPRLTMGEMWLEGSQAVLRLDGDGRLYLRPQGGTEREHAYDWQNRGFGGDCVYALQAHVLAWLAGKSQVVNDGRAYLRNLAVEEAVYRSAESGKTVDVDAD
jgi:predicted dehydrogenase